MIENMDGLLVSKVDACEFCGKPGDLFFENLRDPLFDAPGEWSLMRCSPCRRIWLNPRPIKGEIGKLYEVYHTHYVKENELKPIFYKLRRFVRDAILATRFGYDQLAVNSFQRALGKIVSNVWFMRDAAELSVACLDGRRRGRLLDVGCGTGDFLRWMRELDWEVEGVEPDIKALKAAQSHFGLNVHQWALEEQSFKVNSFDAITLNHVIEHLFDPVSTLKELHRILKPGGNLVVTTPNFESLGARLFGRAWRGWEPPRHLYLFSEHALRVCAEKAGFRVVQLRTTPRSARYMWTASRIIQRDKTLPGGLPQKQNFWLKMEAVIFWITESMFRKSGEELVLIAAK